MIFVNTKTYLCAGIIILFFAFNIGLVINSFGFSGAYFKCCTELEKDAQQECLSDDPQNCQGAGYCAPGWDYTLWGECGGSPWTALCCLYEECAGPDSSIYLASYCLIPPK